MTIAQLRSHLTMMTVMVTATPSEFSVATLSMTFVHSTLLINIYIDHYAFEITF